MAELKPPDNKNLTASGSERKSPRHSKHGASEKLPHPGDGQFPDAIPVKVEEGQYAAFLWDVLGSKMGGDVLNAGISLPCWLFEPLTQLQRGCEIFEYSSCLDKAGKAESPLDCLAHAVAFGVSCYAGSPDRFKTNFNPILGETFEYVDSRAPDNQTRVFAEQTSHYPSQSALHAENDLWSLTQNASAKTEFVRNSLELFPNSKTYIKMKHSGHTLFMTCPVSKIHNVVVGSMWIEHYGDLTVRNLTTGDYAIVEFSKSGVFKIGPEYKVAGCVFDKSGKKIVRLRGEWNSELHGEWLDDTKGTKKGTKLELWKHEKQDFKGLPYRMSKFAISLNIFPSDLVNVILPSDSRRRLDRFYLERGYSDLGTQWKKVAEFRQRQDHVTREGTNEEKGKDEPFDHWTPSWFKLGKDHEGKDFWEWNGTYWDQRAKRAALVADKGPQPWGLPIEGTACDFASYETLYSDLLGKELIPAADLERAKKASQALQEQNESEQETEKKEKKDKRDKTEKRDKTDKRDKHKEKHKDHKDHKDKDHHKDKAKAS